MHKRSKTTARRDGRVMLRRGHPRAYRPRMGRSAWLCVVSFVATAWLGCAVPASDADLARGQEPLIYGSDDRADPYAITDAMLVALALYSTAVLIRRDALTRDARGNVEVTSISLGERRNLCAGESFASQPSAGLCSGVLLTERLILTAGHCVTKVADCSEQTWVFNYAVTEPDVLNTIRSDDLYHCHSVPLAARFEDPRGRKWDFAVVELDRDVSPPRTPVRLSAVPVREDDVMTVIGYPNGLPVKIAGNAPVLDTRSDSRDYFQLASDTFEMSSGSGVFDAAGRLAGIFVRGGQDYEYQADSACFRSRRRDATSTAAEAASYWEPAVACLCDAGWPTLCERTSLPCPADVSVTATAQTNQIGCALISRPRSRCVCLLLASWVVSRRRRVRHRRQSAEFARRS